MGRAQTSSDRPLHSSDAQHRREEVLALKAKGLGLRRIAKELKMPVSSVAKVVGSLSATTEKQEAPLAGGACSAE